MTDSTHLIAIWERATWGAGYLGDAIRDSREDPKHDVTKSLGEALILLTKATAEIQHLLSQR
jgi:hypothetical protein